MTTSQFDRLVNELFGGVLIPLGFTDRASRGYTFHRQVGDVFHIIRPDMGTRGTWYDISVFPSSAVIDPMFEERFPDRNGPPTDVWCRLSESSGVNFRQQQFNCKNEDNFRSRFSISVKRLLTDVAVPYLDGFRSVADILPVIRHSYFLGFALHHLGRSRDARAALEKERKRLETSAAQEVRVVISRIDEILEGYRREQSTTFEGSE